MIVTRRLRRHHRRFVVIATLLCTASAVAQDDARDDGSIADRVGSALDGGDNPLASDSSSVTTFNLVFDL